jgi:hypothetical protein
MDGAITLERVDAVRTRTGASYAACYQALQASGGDVLQAIIHLEEEHPDLAGRLRAWRREVGGQARALAREAGRAHISVSQNGRRIVNLPAALAVLGSAILPGLAAAGLLAAIAARATVTLERDTRE